MPRHSVPAIGVIFLLVAAIVVVESGAALPSAPRVPRIVAQVTLTGQSGPIPTTTLLTPTSSGLYRVSGYLVVVDDTETQGGLTGLVNFTDESGPTAFVFGSAVAGGRGGSQAIFLAHGIAGQPVTFRVDFNMSGGTVNYDVFITVEQLQ